MSAEHWYLLPVGFVIAFLAMSSGVSAGNFWVPVYLLWARLEPALAFWMTLATMLCGYGSGVARNLRQGTLDRHVIIQYLPCTIPAALVGGYLAPMLRVSWLILFFGLFVVGYGMRMLVTLLESSGGESEGRRPDLSSALGKRSPIFPLSLRETAPIFPSSLRETAPIFPLSQRERAPIFPLSLWERARVRDGAAALLGGILLGLITVGLGELLLPRLLTGRKSLSPAEIVGSTVVVIFVTSLAAALVRLDGPLLAALDEQRAPLLGAMVFAGPGVILGGQLGPMVARRLNIGTLRWYVTVILLLVGVLMLVRFLVLVVFPR
jgi:uncharacterized membrane protein YfcA